MEGYKETEGKLPYEINWLFIESMARRMALNKNKYERDNWKKEIDLTSLFDALSRHFIEAHINYESKNFLELQDALVAIANNCMIISCQIDMYKTK